MGQPMDRIHDQRGFGFVETLIGVTILVVGLLAVSGLTIASSGQARTASWLGEQAAVGRAALEAVEELGYESAVGGVDTVALGGSSYPVAVAVTDLSPRVRQVTVTVPAVGDVEARTFSTRLYRADGTGCPTSLERGEPMPGCP